MIIELYGLPGSGKSTWARRYSEEKGVARVRLSSRLETLWYLVLYIVLHPVSSAVLLWYVIKYGKTPFLTYFKFMNVFVDYNAKWMKAQRMKVSSILDQGHYQSIISLFDEVIEEGVIERLIQFFPKPDMLIVFDTPYSVREGFLKVREHGSARDHLSAEDKGRWLRAIELNHETLKKILIEKPYVRTVEDANPDPLLTL